MRILIATLCLIICGHSIYSQERGSFEKKSYYKSGKVKSISYDKNFRRDRITYFDEDGVITSERKYIDQEGHQIISFFEKGKLKSNYIYRYGKRNGKTTGYFDSGSVYWEGSYKNDLRSGKWTLYFENGLIYLISYYEDDKTKLDSVFNIDGRFSIKVEHFYYKKGLEKRVQYNSRLKKVQEAYLKKGKLDGLTINYYENGVVKFTAEYRNGRMYGERLYYNETGGLCDGKFINYDDDGDIEREGICINGKPEGEFKVYDNNKELVIKANFKDGKANGLSYFYNPKDSTVLIEEHKNGKFIREVKDK
ncbi:MAG: hypothetical protein KA444_04385 [Bacteroidia bacterium]|nr:hypothetical protein [Bacteroidia bacterium]